MRKSQPLIGAVIMLGALSFGAVVYAQSIAEVSSAFQRYLDIRPLSIRVPTVVEVNLDDEFIEDYQFAVLNNVTGKFQPVYFNRRTAQHEQVLDITTNSTEGGDYYLTDDDPDTSVDFALPEDNQGTAVINIESAQPVTSSSFTILLDNYVALPTEVAVYATRGGKETTIVAPRRMDSRTVRFLETSSTNWRIELTYGQPLRITELRLSQDNAQTKPTQRLRFLAQPGTDYRVYIGADRSISLYLPEAGDLVSNIGVISLPKTPSVTNPAYIEADTDSDGIPDIRDNCTRVANEDQKDVDENGRGDACDDFDRDGVINSEDNCINEPNKRQLDTDEDGIGDACDGEESRFTEKYKWIPWIGIGFAAVILIVLFFLTAKSARQKNISETSTGEDKGSSTPRP